MSFLNGKHTNIFCIAFLQVIVCFAAADLQLLINDVLSQNIYKTVIVFNSQGQPSFFHKFEIPVLLLPTSNNCSVTDINRKHLTVVFIDDKSRFNSSEIVMIINCLQNKRDGNIIFILNDIDNEFNNTNNHLECIFRVCMENFALNVIAVFKNFHIQNRFYSYTPFPSFELEKKPLGTTYFLDRIINMKKAPIRTLPDQNEPRSIVYRDTNNIVQIVGYTVKIVRIFAQKCNAILVYPSAPDGFNSYIDLVNMAKNYTVDVPMSMSSPVKYINLYQYSDIVEQSVWQPMVPNIPPHSPRNIYLLIFGGRLPLLIIGLLLLLSFILNIAQIALRVHTIHETRQGRFEILNIYLRTILELCPGFFGIPFKLNLTSISAIIKLIYALIFFTGIIVNTFCSSYLQTFLISWPQSKQINTFSELLDSTIKIRISRAEYTTLPLYTGQEFWSKYEQIFKITPTVQQFYNQRKELDTKFGYIVSSSLWPVFDQQQARLEKLLFHLSEDMYFTKGLYLAIPLHEFSIYRNQLNKVIRQLQESGLVKLWLSQVYDDMVTAGKVNKTTNTLYFEKFHSLKYFDLHWIWCFLGIGLAIACGVFLLELIFHHLFYV